MSEEFLQYIWRHRLFSNENLFSTKGEKIEVLNVGMLNGDSGPDFFNASIKIGDTLWAGNVEIHKFSSDWLKHKHQNNEAYNNVILHVVQKNDIDIQFSLAVNIPTLELKFNESLYDNYQKLLAEKNLPACYKQISKIDSIYIRSTIDALLIERLQNKTELIKDTLIQNKNNWSEAFYKHLAINFGFKVNALPFELLSRSISLKVLAHHSKSLLQLEALMHGQSGFLNEQLLGDDYFLKLRDEYTYLYRKYKLNGIENHLWKFMRLRPANFPTIRIAQFAALLNQSEALFSRIIECETPGQIIDMFKIKASEYWDTHYRFNQISVNQPKWLGETSRNNILINTIVPFLYLYGERNAKPELKTRAIEILEFIPSEKNRIIRKWADLGIETFNAYDSQALIQLKNVYCDHKKCLNCQIGIKVISW